jgi:gluconolactonase
MAVQSHGLAAYEPSTDRCRTTAAIHFAPAANRAYPAPMKAPLAPLASLLTLGAGLTLGLGLLAAGCGGDSSGNPDGNTDGAPDGNDGGPDAPPYLGDPLVGIGQVAEVTTPTVAAKFLEGPQWRQAQGDWLFSNIDGNVIYRYQPGGTVMPYLTPSGKSNGLALEAGGTILAAEHDGRRISRINGSTVTPVAERFENKLLSSPNDVIVAADGTIYFTDPPYGLAGRNQELDFNGVFRVSPAGTLTAEYRGAMAERPNGIALSPDGKTVYVAFTQSGEVKKFDVQAGGALGTPSRAAMTAGGADGMAVDAAGNLFVTSNNGIEVFKPDGTKWGQIGVAMKPTNCAFGGPDAKTLMITTPKALYQVTLQHPGLPTK